MVGIAHNGRCAMSDYRMGFRECRATEHRARIKRIAITVLIVALSIAALFAFWQLWPRTAFGGTMRPAAFMPQIVQPLPTALSSTGVVTTAVAR